MTLLVIFPGFVLAQQANLVRSFQIELAQQAVAVSQNYFYVINSKTIVRYEKKTGRVVTRYDGAKDGIKHLNSGIILNGKLYCANSNFPGTPMTSSIEIFDARTLEHIGNHSFGIAVQGSVTWIDRKNGYWWVGFAQYSGKNSREGKDNRWTTVVKYNKKWQQEEAWVFPDNIVKAFGTMSNSGGTWGKDGYLYCTGHDAAELYVMKVPDRGYTLQHIRTIPAPIHGQGIAIDHSEKKKLLMYGIGRPKKIVVFGIE